MGLILTLGRDGEKWRILGERKRERVRLDL